MALGVLGKSVSTIFSRPREQVEQQGRKMSAPPAVLKSNTSRARNGMGRRSISSPALLQGINMARNGVSSLSSRVSLPSFGSFLGGADRPALGEEHLLSREEVLAVRLYTGPGYAPINGWLREVGNLPKEPPEGFLRWGAWTEARGQMTPEEARRSAALDYGSSFGATVGHLTSAIRKIAAASTQHESERRLYRGLKGKLEPRFWMPDGFGIVCATDTAFMSTSLSGETALFYLSKKDYGQPNRIGLLWELKAGQEDDTGLHVGADVSDLSQFPHEKEILFPPLVLPACMSNLRAGPENRRLLLSTHDSFVRARVPTDYAARAPA